MFNVLLNILAFFLGPFGDVSCLLAPVRRRPAELKRDLRWVGRGMLLLAARHINQPVRCVVDMGEPVRIKALAEQMVWLSGLSVRDAANPAVDIEIVCNGLRPGEKLDEELLIDEESEAAAHPLIDRARERALPPDALRPQIDALAVLARLVPEWRRSWEPDVQRCLSRCSGLRSSACRCCCAAGSTDSVLAGKPC